MIVALAGRRIDAHDTNTPRFPSNLAESVKQRLIETLRSVSAIHLVCSAACGADLLALEAAAELKIPKTVILPFDADTFRSTSVTDRPGDWGLVYDSIVQHVTSPERIIVLDYDKNDPAAYEKTNLKILDHAEKLAGQSSREHNHSGEKMALIVWEGKPKDADDTTYHFMQEAQKRNFTIKEIKIIE